MTTLQKIAIARLVSKMLCAVRKPLGLGSMLVCRRHGIMWHLDLKEGFDLAIYLFGSSEPGVVSAFRRLFPKGGNFLDIGANIGGVALPLTLLAGTEGKVYAFEPTDFAFAKINRNIALNPEISKRIKTAQVFLGAPLSTALPESVPSSWPLRQEKGLDTLHGGRLENLQGARHETLDDWMSRENPPRIDMIKLDVDGYETNVLSGAKLLFQYHRPAMAVEFAPDVFLDKPGGFANFIDLLREYGFEAKSLNGKKLPLDSSLEAKIPPGCGINALLTPH